MATVNFLYRSTKERAPLTVRLQFWIQKTSYFLDAKTELFVTDKEWELYRKNKNSNNRDAAIKNLKAQINSELQSLEEKILTGLNSIRPEDATKEWMKSIVHQHYHPELQEKPKEVPTALLKFLDYYLENKPKISVDTRKKMNVLKNKLVRFERFRGKPVHISEIGEHFSVELVDFLRDFEGYTDNTIQRDFGSIVTLCRFAHDKKIPLASDFKEFSFVADDKCLYEILTFEEIQKIEQFEGLSESLDNVRDWLLISLYTAARVGDFLRFDHTMIREEKGRLLLEFEQKKVKQKGVRKVSIAITQPIMKILQKRDGQFPRRISDQKYNKYVKEVLKEVGFTEAVQGYKKIKIAEGVWRKQLVTAPRYEFFSSHAARRSFATNFFGKLPTQDIMHQTGHQRESTFLTYINKKSSDRALEIAPKLEAFFNQKEEKASEKLSQLQELIKNGNPELEEVLNKFLKS